jgi:hypothetical protein
MSFLMSTGQMINNNNRRLQRKGKVVFQQECLPVMSKRTTQVMEPVSPTLARKFRARTESDRKRNEMAIGLLLIIILGASVASTLAFLGIM